MPLKSLDYRLCGIFKAIDDNRLCSSFFQIFYFLNFVFIFYWNLFYEQFDLPHSCIVLWCSSSSNLIVILFYSLKVCIFFKIYVLFMFEV